MMTKKAINGVISKLYDAVQKSGWSSHLFHDDDWSHLYEIRNICNSALENNFQCVRQEIYGYCNNNLCKQYLFTIEDINTGERIIDVSVNAHAAGRMNDVWSAYDCTAIFFAHE